MPWWIWIIIGWFVIGAIVGIIVDLITGPKGIDSSYSGPVRPPVPQKKIGDMTFDEFNKAAQKQEHKDNYDSYGSIGTC